MTATQPPINNLQQQFRLKVCGLTKTEQIHELISLGTDFLGFIFYEKSPRYALNHLTLNHISTITHPEKVGVFVNEKAENILETVEKSKLNLIQLHGNEKTDLIYELRKKMGPEVKIIKVIRIGDQKVEELQKIIDHHQKNIDYFLFDTDSSAFGGTGKTFDWNLLNDLEISLPYFLSGGISLENIEEIKRLKQKPFAVDINSRFETKPGIKDVEKIKKFKNEL